jgi:hypothetical protein
MNKSKSVHANIAEYLVSLEIFRIDEVIETIYGLSTDTKIAVMYLSEILDSSIFLKNRDYYVLQKIKH